MPVSSACRLLQIDVFEPVDLIHGHDLLDDEVFHDILMLAESGMIGAALAAPYCSKHSRATLRRPGPRPVRTPSHLDGVPDNTVDQQLSVQESSISHDRARMLLSAVDRQNGLAILENPSSSMTWLDEWMCNWVHTVAPFAAHASACQFGQDWAKTWCFVPNKSQIEGVARSCDHPPGTHESVVGVRLPGGSFKSRLTAEYPQPLAATLAQIIAEFTTLSGQVQSLCSWRQTLPHKIQWPDSPHRIEDGGGLPSSALSVVPRGVSLMKELRMKWFRRLSDTQDCLRIVAKLQTGHPGPPMNGDELQPYLMDILEVLGCESNDQILQITPGQPFRLRLWKQLVLSRNDPDAEVLDLLAIGVPLGVNEPLEPSPAWPLTQPAVPTEVPLVECTSSWKSAANNLPLVRELIAEEVASGFISLVEGGLQELQAQHPKTAVGKLGLVHCRGPITTLGG